MLTWRHRFGPYLSEHWSHCSPAPRDSFMEIERSFMEIEHLGGAWIANGSSCGKQNHHPHDHPGLATTTSVAGDRAALPASMTRRPAVVAGPVDTAGTPHSAYPSWSQASAPCRHSCRASILRGTDQHESNWPGNAVPTASSTPSTSSGSGGIRQSDGLLRVARRRRFHVTLVAMKSGQDHEASDYSHRRRPRSPRHGGMIPAIATGAPTTDRVITSKLALPPGCLQQHQGGTWH